MFPVDPCLRTLSKDAVTVPENQLMFQKTIRSQLFLSAIKKSCSCYFYSWERATQDGSKINNYRFFSTDIQAHNTTYGLCCYYVSCFAITDAMLLFDWLLSLVFILHLKFLTMHWCDFFCCFEYWFLVVSNHNGIMHDFTHLGVVTGNKTELSRDSWIISSVIDILVQGVCKYVDRVIDMLYSMWMLQEIIWEAL